MIRNRISVDYMDNDRKKSIMLTKAANSYKSKHDWVGKMIFCELCKKLKFDNDTTQESIIENA